MKCTNIVAFAAGTLIFGIAAVGQPARFTLVDITEIGFEPNIQQGVGLAVRGTVGLNNLGEVVYTRMVNGQLQAWVYLPDPGDYGLPTQTPQLSST